MASGAWNDALVAAAGVSIFFSVTCLVYLTLGSEFTTTKFAAYHAICERLEVIGRITDAAECFHRMESELGPERHDEQAKWTAGEWLRITRKCCHSCIYFILRLQTSLLKTARGPRGHKE